MIPAAPLLSDALLLLVMAAFGLGVGALVLLLAAAIHRLVDGFRARRVVAALRERGYDDVSWEAASMLGLRADASFPKRLPPRDELAVVPGYEASRGEFLLDVSRMLSRWRRRRLERTGGDYEFVSKPLQRSVSP